MESHIIQCKDIGHCKVKIPCEAIFNDFSSTSVWVASLDGLADNVLQFKSLLDKKELARMEKFYFKADVNRYIIGRAMLKKVLSNYLSIAPAQLNIALGKKNKPCFPESQKPVHFNLSHSGHFVLMALSFQAPLGVDVEEIKPGVDYDGIINRYFNQNERSVIYSGNGSIHNNFYAFWTKKEALLKAAGVGLIDDLKLLDMTGRTRIASSVLQQYPGWFNHDFFVQSFMVDENHAGALATTQNYPSIDFYRFYPFPDF